MVILNRKEFLELSCDTIFSKYKECCFESICIKGATIGNDWFNIRLMDAVKKIKTTNYALDLETESRNAEFDEEQMFAVYEKEDVEKLIKKLKDCL